MSGFQIGDVPVELYSGSEAFVLNFLQTALTNHGKLWWLETLAYSRHKTT
jgi:hypothetical protein